MFTRTHAVQRLSYYNVPRFHVRCARSASAAAASSISAAYPTDSTPRCISPAAFRRRSGNGLPVHGCGSGSFFSVPYTVSRARTTFPLIPSGLIAKGSLLRRAASFRSKPQFSQFLGSAHPPIRQFGCLLYFSMFYYSSVKSSFQPRTIRQVLQQGVKLAFRLPVNIPSH